VRGFHPATERVWAIFRQRRNDEWFASPVLGWTGEGEPVYFDGERLAVIGPDTPHLWSISPDYCVPSEHVSARRAVACALTGSYALATDEDETVPFGEGRAA
jgi:hypothetical protein